MRLFKRRKDLLRMHCRLAGGPPCSDKCSLPAKDAAALLQTSSAMARWSTDNSGSLVLARAQNNIAHRFKSNDSMFVPLMSQKANFGCSWTRLGPWQAQSADRD